ncbi:MAG: tetratricopeptide repeat protein [Bdellovibrionota bacterium]
MIKLFGLIFLGLTMLSCSTSLVTENSELLDIETNTASVAPVKQETSKSPSPSVPSAPVVIAPTVDISYRDLEKAITSGNNESIKTISNDLLQMNSKDLKALNALAMYYYNKQQLAAAELLLNKALTSHPKSSAVYNNLGLIELAKNEKKEAINMFHKALELDSKNHSAAANIAAIYVKNKSYQYAVIALEKFADIKLIGVDSLNNYAIALQATGKLDDASDIYESILKKVPDHKSALLNFSILLIEKQAKYNDGLDIINRLKFVGIDNESRELIKNLENKAKAGLK